MTIGRITFAEQTPEEQRAYVERILAAQRAVSLKHLDERTHRHLVSAARERLEAAVVHAGGLIEMVSLQKQAGELVNALLAELRGKADDWPSSFPRPDFPTDDEIERRR